MLPSAPVEYEKQQVELIFQSVLKTQQDEFVMKSSNDGEPCGKHDGNVTMLLASCIKVRKVYSKVYSSDNTSID